jgi:UDP-glucuronate 4-epimerase
MKILLTGAAGFIGSHVCEALLKRGDEVVGIDNLNDYYDVSLKNKNLDILKKYEKFKFLKHDISEPINLKESFDLICHLAAQAGVRYSLTNPQVYELSNNLGTLNIFEYARKNNIPKIVYASSSSVYGNTDKVPFEESMDVSNPVSFYAATKKSNELYAHTYHYLYKIKMIGLRFFTVYGPRGRPDMAPMLFTNAINNDEEIKIFNNGDMRRDFTFVEDIVQGVIKSIDANLDFEIINLGRGEPVDLLEFITIIEKELGKSARKKYLPMQPGDVKQTYADITKAKRLLNYEPKTSIDEGVKKFIEWYKTN